MANFAEKYGPWALITGASAGIGRELARQIAERGLNVALVARRADMLKALAAEISGTYGVETRTITCDLSRDDYLEVIDQGSNDLEIGLLINNAGAPSYHGWFMDRKPEDIEKTLHFSVHVQIHLIHHFGNKMVERSRGGIMQVSSVTGHISMPFMAEYSAAKGYQIQFTEAINYELALKGIDVVVLSPGATKTERLDMGMDAAIVAKKGLDTLGRRPTVIAGLKNQWSAFKKRHLMSRKLSLNTSGDYQYSQLNPSKSWGGGGD